MNFSRRSLAFLAAIWLCVGVSWLTGCSSTSSGSDNPSAQAPPPTDPPDNLVGNQPGTFNGMAFNRINVGGVVCIVVFPEAGSEHVDGISCDWDHAKNEDPSQTTNTVPFDTTP